MFGYKDVVPTAIVLDFRDTQPKIVGLSAFLGMEIMDMKQPAGGVADAFKKP